MEQLMLFSLEPKIKRAIENFKMFEETALKMHPNGYYLSFSGGNSEKTVILLNNDNHEKRRPLENCAAKGKFILNPIIDWTTEEVWCFLSQYVGTYCCLYDCGFSRLGCIGCPLASVRQRKWELARYPKYKQAYLKSFDRMLKERQPRETGAFKHWETADEVYYWWLYGSGPSVEQVPGQLNLDLQMDIVPMADIDNKVKIQENADGQLSIFGLAS